MGNESVTDKKTALDKYEIIAVQIANDCKNFIEFVRNPHNNIDDFMKSQYLTLKKNTLHILEKINQEALNNELPEINNYYYLYLLQQVTKFNQYVNQNVIINDNRKSEHKVTVLNKPHSQYKALRRASITTIVHPLLNQPETIKINVDVEQNNIFRDTYIDDDEGPRYYYHERTTEKGHKHQDREHYMTANIMIGSATQLSNASGLFKSAEQGQGTHHYFKHADRKLHKREQQLFRSAMNNIHTGEPLSKDERQILESGTYYRYNSPVKFRTVMNKKSVKNNLPPETDRDYQITHIGHAAEFISMQNRIPLNLCIDPVHYQSGTGGIIGIGGKVMYDRYTDPAFGTDGYPGINIVVISHNHFDHMCEASIKEAFGQSNTLFVVPAGDAKHLKAFGITNVVEMGSWNDVLRIKLSDEKGNSSSYEIMAFPANHASCRGTTDLFESLYMGYMIRDVTKNHIVLCTGDTAVLEADHFQQLGQYLLDKSYTISTACIAHGPDRPRSWMECTHQSTADAITMHAEFNVMNANVFAKQLGTSPDKLSFEQLQKSACYAIGYHQGCYRLGLLSLSDVDTTLLRTLSVLASFGDRPVNEITPDILKKNVFFNFMDKFEQKSLISTLEVYSRLKIETGCLTAAQTLRYITSHLNVPQPGSRADFSKNQPYEQFVFDYERLLLNKNPDLKSWDENKFKGATEEFCYQLNPELYQGDFNKNELIIRMLTIYLERKIYNFTKPHGHDLISQFVDDLRQGKIQDNELDEKLGELYANTHPQQDEHIRDEGHSHTALTIIAGLLHFPDFREKMHARYNELHNIVTLEEGIELEIKQISVNY